MLTILLALLASFRLSLPDLDIEDGETRRMVPFAFGYNGLVDDVWSAPVYNPAARGHIRLVNPGKKHPRFERTYGA